MRTLVVDDDPITRYVVARGLSLHGLESDEAGSGEEALDLLATNVYAAVVLDLVMPNCRFDGWAVIDRIGSVTASPPPILVFSVLGDSDHSVQMSSPLIRHVFHKPFDIGSVARAVRSMVEDQRA
jgi:DNA-binding response OmpR family regulator